MTLKRGTQIAYIPMHCNDDLFHPDVEYGFVTSVRDDVAFCRYWSKFTSGHLRTQANSEATPIDMIVICQTRPQFVIENWLRQIDEQTAPTPLDAATDAGAAG
jgi:hypothetical protein